ncbi:MAG: DsbA family protein [Sphingomonadales bacterium]
MLKTLSPRAVILALAATVLALAGVIAYLHLPALNGQNASSRLNVEDRDAIGAVVRDYILANPEIIPEAIQVLQQRQRGMRLASMASELTPGPASLEAGNPQGDVTLIEFFDFRCPFCKRAYADVEKLIADDANLRVIFKQFPILDQGDTTVSYDLARAGAAAARQGDYLDFHDAVFGWPKRVENIGDIIAIAQAAGLDTDRLRQDMDDPAIARAIERNIAIGQALGLGGTPAYVVGEQIIEGAVGYDRLAQAVAAARRGNDTASGG